MIQYEHAQVILRLVSLSEDVPENCFMPDVRMS